MQYCMIDWTRAYKTSVHCPTSERATKPNFEIYDLYLQMIKLKQYV